MSKASAELTLTAPIDRQVKRREPDLEDAAAGERAGSRRSRRRAAGRRRGPSRAGTAKPPHLVDAAGDVAQGDRRAGQQAADEAAAGLVVTGEQQPQRHQQHGVEHDPHRDVDEGEPAHGPRRRPGVAAGARAARRPTRASATAPIEATASTVISPRVSKPRKSTRITLTTLRPWPSGTERATISSDTGGVSR